MVLPSLNNNNGSVCSRTSIMICCTKRSVTMAIMMVVFLLYVLLVISRDPSSLQDSNKSRPAVSDPVRLRPDGYRLCQAFTAEGEALTVGQAMHKVPKLMAPMGIPFQCAGPPYEEFGARLEKMLQQRASTAPLSDHWGKRTMPILPHAAGNRMVPPPTFVLFMGTMHLRQVVSAMLCQYSHRIISAKRIYSSKRTSIGSFSIQVVLHDNIHIFIVLNPPFVYDYDNWQDLLERHVLNMPLAVMDLVIMSQFHTFSKQLGIAFEEFWMDHENDWTVPDMVHEDPISFVDLLQPSEHTEGAIVYEGPMIYVSSFAPHGRDEYYQVQATIEALATASSGGGGSDITLPDDPRDLNKLQKLEHEYEKVQQLPPPDQKQQQGLSEEAQDRLTYKASPPKFHEPPHRHHRHHRRLRSLKAKKTTNTTSTARTITKSGSQLSRRTNLIAVDARKYVPSLGECATNKGDTVGTCILDHQDPHYSTGARCFGAKGGHPDLVAWDLIEAIYKVMWNKL